MLVTVSTSKSPVFVKVEYIWIDFHSEIHEISKAAPLRARVDERVGSAGEIHLQREGGYGKRCWKVRVMLCQSGMLSTHWNKRLPS